MNEVRRSQGELRPTLHPHFTRSSLQAKCTSEQITSFFDILVIRPAPFYLYILLEFQVFASHVP